MDATWQGTVLLADVRRDAAKLYAAVGPAKALETIRQCMERLEQAARTAGGHVIRAVGDEVLALFPAPSAAADAAAGMQLAAEMMPIVANVKLGVRIAFHSGPVTVRDGDVQGDTVVLTTRMLQQARSEQIITSTNTAAALDQSYRKRLRPVAEHVASCELVWQVGGETTNLGEGLRVARVGSRTITLKYGVSEAQGLPTDARPVRLGRDINSHLCILDDLASRQHCTIERNGDVFILRDHSTNGTFITDEGAAEVRVHHGAVVLGAHGWLAFGQPRQGNSQVVEYSVR
jgi:adenylate cyclase